MFGRMLWYGIFLFIVAIGSFVAIGVGSHWGMCAWAFFSAVLGSFWLPRWRDQYIPRDVCLSFLPVGALLTPVGVLSFFHLDHYQLVSWYGRTDVVIELRWIVLATVSFVVIFTTLRYQMAEREL